MDWLEKIDGRLTDWLYIDRIDGIGQSALLAIASLAIYLVPVILLLEFFHRRHRLSALKATLVGLFSWLAVAWPVGNYLFNQFGWRWRPLADLALLGRPSMGEWLLETPFKAFPSDHSALLMAVTLVYFASVHRRLAWWLLALTVAVGLGRVMIGYHFVGDILGGWLIAVVVFGLSRLVNRPLERLIAGGLRLFKLDG